MIDPDFLAMLVCPTTHQPLRAATEAELAAVNAAIAGGSAKSRGGVAVVAALVEGLVTEDGAWVYPIQDGIPILLAADAIAVGGTT
jgi:uncharacterized protein YbaR (Trm112 family)